MNCFFSKTPTSGLSSFEDGSKDGYIIAKNYILIELFRDSYILDFYIVPSKDKTCVILCHIPELEIIDSMKTDQFRMLKLMEESKLFAKIIRNSLDASKSNDFKFVKIPDFVNPDSETKNWCVSYSTLIPYNKVIFDATTEESKFIGQILTDFCYVVDDFYGVYDKYRLNPYNKSWIINSRVRKLSKIAYKVHKAEWCTFGCSLRDDTLREPVKELILKEGYIVLTNTGIGYPFDIPIPRTDINDSLLIVRADLFFPALLEDNFVYFIHLKSRGENMWDAYINIDKDIIFAADHWLNFIDTKPNKIPAFAYKYLPYSAHIWVNSNLRFRNTRFMDHIDCVLESDKKILELPFKDEYFQKIIKSENSLKFMNPINIFFSDKPWKNLEPLAELIFYGLVVSWEVQNIVDNIETIKSDIKQRNKQQWVELLINTAKIFGKMNRIL